MCVSFCLGFFVYVVFFFVCFLAASLPLRHIAGETGGGGGGRSGSPFFVFWTPASQPFPPPILQKRSFIAVHACFFFPTVGKVRSAHKTNDNISPSPYLPPSPPPLLARSLATASHAAPVAASRSATAAPTSPGPAMVGVRPDGGGVREDGAASVGAAARAADGDDAGPVATRDATSSLKELCWGCVGGERVSFFCCPHAHAKPTHPFHAHRSCALSSASHTPAPASASATRSATASAAAAAAAAASASGSLSRRGEEAAARVGRWGRAVSGRAETARGVGRRWSIAVFFDVGDARRRVGAESKSDINQKELTNFRPPRAPRRGPSLSGSDCDRHSPRPATMRAGTAGGLASSGLCGCRPTSASPPPPSPSSPGRLFPPAPCRLRPPHAAASPGTSTGRPGAHRHGGRGRRRVEGAARRRAAHPPASPGRRRREGGGLPPPVLPLHIGRHARTLHPRPIHGGAGGGRVAWAVAAAAALQPLPFAARSRAGPRLRPAPSRRRSHCARQPAWRPRCALPVGARGGTFCGARACPLPLFP